MNRPVNSFVYFAPQVSALMGVGCPATTPPHRPEYDDEIVVWYGGWTLPALRRLAGASLMSPNSSDDKGWGSSTWPTGYYRVLPWLPGSRSLPEERQREKAAAFGDGRWFPAPIAVAATALVVHLASAGQSALRHGWCRCQETPSTKLLLTPREGKLHVIRSTHDDINAWLAVCHYDLSQA